jgi:hypothetical protein
MWRRFLAIAIVGLAAVVPYLSVIDDYFVQDDFGVVSLLAEKPPTAFFGWFAIPWMDDIWGYTPDEIRPFPAATYQLTALWGAASPVANHVLNIALHAATALLVVAVGVWGAGLSLGAAVFAGTVFALHPAQAETVAWVTGRVDSMPAFFYIGAFLAYVRWRAAGVMRLYYVSLVLFAAALFSKQNTVTLAPALVLFDVIVGRRHVRASWTWLRAYVPFVALTAAYLALRYALFGEIARESSLTAQNMEFVVGMGSRHVRRIVAGDVVPVALVATVLMTLLIGAVVASLRSPISRSAIARSVMYFGVIWTVFGLAPTLVAGYESPRHAYLASLGWTVTLGIAADVLWRAFPARVVRPVTAAACLLLTGMYAVQLRSVVHDWSVRADVSRRAVADLEREVLAAPRGSLVLIGAPRRSWEWALPFAARPPFAGEDLTERAVLLYPPLLHCCRSQWESHTRQALAEWIQQPGSREVIALSWDMRTGELSRRSAKDEPYLRALVEALAGVEDPSAFERVLHGAIAVAATRNTR